MTLATVVTQETVVTVTHSKDKHTFFFPNPQKNLQLNYIRKLFLLTKKFKLLKRFTNRISEKTEKLKR